MTSGKYLFEPDDVLYSKIRPYLRKALVSTFRGVCSADIYPIRVNKNLLDPLFTAWLLVSDEFTRYADAESRRARMPKLNRGQLFSWLAPIPPLKEQQRIAAILTEQLAAVEQARAAAQVRVEVASALPAAYLRAIFSESAKRNWPKKRLGEAGEIVSGVTLGRRLPNGNTRDVPYLRVANVKDGCLDLSVVYQIAATPGEIDKLTLKYGDLLLTEGGDPDKLGRGTYWRDEIAECIHQNHIFRVRFDLSEYSPDFVSAQIASAYGKMYFFAHAKQTTGIATINQKVLAGFPLLSPPIGEQKRVAGLLQEQMAATGRARELAEEELTSINALPASLRRRAFNGEL